jgi:hypothetical protein
VTFFWGVVFALAAKLWLTSEIRIVPAYLPHDAENYVSHARSILSGLWFGNYSDMTLIKEPFYPIYLALVHETGLTVPVANTLLYAVACLLACIAIRPLVRNGLVLAGIFAVLLFEPMTYSQLAWMATRSEVNDSLALAAVACALAILVRRRRTLRALIWWWLGLSISLGAFWITREESIWLVPSVLVILGVYVCAIRKDPALRANIVALLLPLVFCYAAQAGVGRINQHVYGWNTAVETKAPEFVSAYNSFARIIPAQEEDRITVPRSSREMAYRVSPAARELEPWLEGPVGKGWTAMVCAYPVHICNDIAGSFFIWAFRDSVAAAGHYTSGRDARLFYLQLASEIDRACDAGQIRCRPKAATIFPNPTLAQVPAILANVRHGVRILTGFTQFSPNHAVVPINPVIDDEYAFVVGTISRDAQAYQGWIATDRPAALSVESATGVPEAIEGTVHSPSPDVAAALDKAGRRGWDDGRARFSFTVNCADACFLVATGPRNAQTKIPLNTATTDFSGPHAIYHLDNVAGPPRTADANLKNVILVAIAGVYQVLTPLLAVLCALVVIGRPARAAVRRRFTLPSAPYVLAVAAAAGGGLLVGILSALTVSYSASLDAEYLSSFLPLMLFALIVVLVFETSLAYRFVRRRRRARGA